MLKSIELTGIWRQEIPEREGELGKTDFVLIEQRGDQLTGSIRRLLPESERFKRWDFEAKIRKRLVFGTFWPHDENKNPKSHGALCLNLISDTLLDGFLVEILCADGGEEYRWTAQVKNMARWIKNQG